MRSLFLFLLAISLFSIKSSAQTFGEANVFGWDATGNRVVRNFIIDAVFKMGSTNMDSNKLDTAVIKKDIQGQNNNNENIVIKAYPNPVSNILTVENLSWKDEYKVTIMVYDEAGQFISKKNINQAKDTIPFDGLAPGTYMVHYYIKGSLLTVWKIIKL